MRCPRCDGRENKVVDTRTSRGGRAVRRRRECLECGERFTTYEYVEARPIQVLKADGSAQEFDREKLTRSLRIACAKRPVAAADIERLIGEIEAELQQMGKAEVPSRLVGDKVIRRLKELDEVAYIRYAIVYLRLDDLESIRGEIDHLLVDQ